MQGAGVRPPRASVHGVLGLAFVAALAGACNLVNGSGDLEVGGNFGTTDTLPDGGRGGDGASSGGDGGGTTTDGGGTTTDGGGDNAFIPDPGVNPKVSPCGTNLVCLPNVGGWSPALYVPAIAGPTGTDCPPEYPQRTDVQQSGGGGCDCSCSAHGGSCAGSVDSLSGALCAGPPVDLVLTSGSCSAVTRDLPLPVAFKAHPSGQTPTSCGATVAPQLNMPRAATYCTGAVPASGSCAQGEVCVSKPSLFGARFACILHDGNIACPNRLSFRTVVGTTVTDGRSCSATCACQTEPCGGTLEAFSDPACATSVRSLAVDGSCTTAGTAPSGASYRYTPSLGCGVSTPAKVLGSETYTGMQTLCCSFGF